MKKLAIMTFSACVIALFAAPTPVSAAAPSDAVAQKTIKTLLNTIRYGKDDLAAKQVAFTTMAKELLADAWGKASAAEQKEIAEGLEVLIRRISFPAGRKMFKHLDAVLYDKVRTKGEQALCKTTVVVHRNYKKTEIIIDFVLVEEAGAWKVVDTILVGESTLEAIREDDVEPLLDEGGMAALLKALRKKIKETE